MTRFVPSSTYRYQISPSFTLQDAARDLPRLVDLGVGAIYLSPVLQATSGSDHGYDWVDPSRVDDARGGETGWATFVAEAQRLGLPIVLDLVPNHCGISKPWENPAWWSVLREGRASAYAPWFDIDWTTGPIVVPVLPEDGSLAALQLSDARDELLLGDYRLPVAAGTADDGADAATVATRQHYRLAAWPLEATELNHRRFFAVSTLVGLRVEDPRVFEQTHARVLRMVDEGQVQGLRLDVPDCLLDPTGYFERLRARVGEECWIVIEKVFTEAERLPQEWPVDGTTGYDAMARLTELFVPPSGIDELTRGYPLLTGDTLEPGDHVVQGVREAARTLFGSERARIRRLLPATLRTADHDQALIEIAAHMGVYRTYLPLRADEFDEAVRRARHASPELRTELDALASVLRDPQQEAAKRFEQFTAALAAKGLEDTVCYRYSRFIGVNEVGGDPARPTTTIADWHTEMAHRQQHSCAAMTATSTHDTKRGEDIRAALAGLSEFPREALVWGDLFQASAQLEDASFAWFLAQTLAVATLDAPRLHAYATKAMRETHTQTSWSAPNAAFEQTVHAAIDAALTDPALAGPLADLRALIADTAASNVIAQKVVALTMPGVPDIYRGTEWVEDSLVDPDNRRPVDFARDLTPLDLAKHRCVRTVLRLRRDRPELFTSYAPLLLEGPLGEHLVGFDRGGALTLAVRLPETLHRAGGWGETMLPLPEGEWVDVLSERVFTGDTLLAEVFAELPAAVLVRR